MDSDHITAHFTWAEAQVTKTGLPNDPPVFIRARLEALCEWALEPIRALLGVPLKVDSMYRSSAVNAAVGGSASSQHMLGEAADVVPLGLDRVLAFKALLWSGLTVDQCIVYETKPHLHISYTTRRANRREYLVCTKAGEYVAWSKYHGPLKP